ncbi:MAG: hypothetical protein ACTSXL_03515 [Alphaproteobacteria bacterium]|nr:MAG: hypothetical protein B6I23_00090 [Rickettsiaceae bacterium 4572_127]
MENVKSSLKELKGVLAELQNKIIETKAQPAQETSYVSGLENEEREELNSLRNMKNKISVAITSIIEKLENELK